MLKVINSSEIYFKKYTAKAVFSVLDCVTAIEASGVSFNKSIPNWWAKSQYLSKKSVYLELNNFSNPATRLSYISSMIRNNWEETGKLIDNFFAKSLRDLLKKNLKGIDFKVCRQNSWVYVYMNHKNIHDLSKFLGECREMYIPKSDAYAEAVKDLTSENHNIVRDSLYYGKYRYKLNFGKYYFHNAINPASEISSPWVYQAKNSYTGRSVKRRSSNPKIEYANSISANQPHSLHHIVSMVENIGIKGSAYVVDNGNLNIYLSDEEDVVLLKLSSSEKDIKTTVITLSSEIQ